MGSGPALVILHGLFGSWENWRVQAKQLSEYFTVYAMDIRNHGRSPHVDEIDYPLMAGDVLHTLQIHRVRRASLMGHSMGGKVAMRVALDSPEVVQKLIVVDIAPREYEPGHNEIFDALFALKIDVLRSRSEADEFIKPWVDDASIRAFLLKNLARTPNGFEWKMNLTALKKNYSRLIGGIDSDKPFRGPVLFIKGAKSDYIQRVDQEKILRLFPNAAAKIIDSAGHWPHAEKSHIFNKIASDFLLSDSTAAVRSKV